MNPNGLYHNSNVKPSVYISNDNFDEKHTDKNGSLKLSMTWLVAFGRTFRSGSLNIPVNVFYSSQGKGGLLGLSLGFNLQNAKK